MIKFIYGTAWKGEITGSCVYRALKAGFRGIDTANQPKHYHEEGVGAGVSRAISRLKLKRKDLFLQTKFTYADFQDRGLPYDKNSSPGDQARQSLESSLEHLKTPYLDSFLMHSPQLEEGLTATDWEVWKT